MFNQLSVCLKQVECLELCIGGVTVRNENYGLALSYLKGHAHMHNWLTTLDSADSHAVPNLRLESATPPWVVYICVEQNKS